MKNRTLKIMLSATLLCALSPNLFAQRPTAATHVSRADIMTVFEHMGETIDQQIRVVDIGDEVNVGVGILQRKGNRTEGEVVNAIVHHNITEVYYVLSGSGTLVTGGDISGDREFPADNISVVELIGPSGSRTVINGQTKTISAGDVVIIPAGVPHGFRNIQDQITYLSVRVDPDQVLPTGYEHPSLEE
ncbi:MAG: cupin domain-containing protein [Gammaproteobacteria bacterium]|nr:cupin domain-containing protein [Gammaproteobacteria bacterium]